MSRPASKRQAVSTLLIFVTIFYFPGLYLRAKTCLEVKSFTLISSSYNFMVKSFLPILQIYYCAIFVDCFKLIIKILAVALEMLEMIENLKL